MSCYFSVTVFVVLATYVRADDVFTNKFCDVRFRHTFIDKTPLIYEVFKHENLFLNAPHNFGKSVNIGMLNLFLSNLYTKETAEEYFNGTEIWKDEEFVREHMGNYPVILYNVSVCGVVHDEEHMMATFLFTMHNTFKDHEYLLKNTNLSSEHIELLKIFMNAKKIQNMQLDSITKGLSFLAHMLYIHHEKPVILLADGFGSGVIERILEDNIDMKHLSPVVTEWYSAIINETFFDQEVITRAVVSGETWLYGLMGPAQSLFEKVGFMEKKGFSHFHGFTYDELEYLLCKFNIPLKIRPKILKWYCGYCTADGEVKVCNPISILRFLASPYHVIKVYWTGSPIGPDILQRMALSEVYQKHLHNWVFNHPVNITLEQGIIGEEVSALHRKVEKLQQDSESFICQVMIEVGYLTHTGPLPSGGSFLKIPNEEIRLMVDKFISLLSFV